MLETPIIWHLHCKTVKAIRHASVSSAREMTFMSLCVPHFYSHSFVRYKILHETDQTWTWTQSFASTRNWYSFLRSWAFYQWRRNRILRNRSLKKSGNRDKSEMIVTPLFSYYNIKISFVSVVLDPIQLC